MVVRDAIVVTVVTQALGRKTGGLVTNLSFRMLLLDGAICRDRSTFIGEVCM